MELDSFLYKVQGVLKTEERSLGSLYNLKKENQDDISKVEASLKKVITEKQDDTNQKVKVQLYILLFLNTESNLYCEMKKSRKCAHLVGFFPKISQDLFMKLVFGLNLNAYLYESVKHFSSCLSINVLDICLKSLKWIDLFEAVNMAENLIISLFCKIIETDENDKYHNHLKDLFQRFILHFDAEKGGSVKRMGSWKKAKLKHYGGLVVASLLEIVNQCSRIFCQKKSLDDTVDNAVFKIQFDSESMDLKFLPDLTNGSITVQECYNHLVARCLQNVSDITLDIWLFWLEIDLDEIPDTENTLQKLVGEKAYKCREALQETESLGVSSKESSELVNRLANIAIKPRTEEDLAASLDLEKILENIGNPEKDSSKWMKYLINNPSFVVDPSALEVLVGYVSSLDSDNISKLSKTIFEHMKCNSNCEHQKSFILEMMNQCDIDALQKVSDIFVKTLGISDFLKQEDFQPTLVETFNMVINEEDKEKELHPLFLRLALQDARAVVKQATSEGITSEVRGHLMADVLSKLEPFCNAVLPSGHSLLVAALDELLLSVPELPENQRVNYPLFVRELVMRNNLNGGQFIKNCLMGKLYFHIKSKNWTLLSTSLETLSELFDMDCEQQCPATLMMLMQVVEASRCQPNDFNMAAIQVCQQALHLIPQYVSKWYNQGVEDKYLKNLTTMVNRYVSPLNRFHLSRLMSDNEPAPVDPALRLLYRTHYGIGEWSVANVGPDERLKLIYSLCFVLPMLTASEWQEMFCVVAPKCSEFLTLFHIVTDALLLCLESAKMKPDNQTVVNCLNYAILNIAQVVKDELNRWTKDDNEYRISVLSKICQLMSNLPSDQQESFSLTLVKVLQQLLPEGSRRKPLTAQEMNTVTASIGSIKSLEVRQNLAREFLEMVHR